MKFLSLIFAMYVAAVQLQAQTWTEEQIRAANTADTISSLTEEERDVFLYLNLARMYPKDFVKFELSGGQVKDNYLLSLQQKLRSQRPLNPVHWNAEMQALATCYSAEQSRRGTIGHQRKDCTEGFNAECVSYGMNGGRDIVLQLLIDRGVPDYGHRKICLLGNIRYLGVSANEHPKNLRCCVLDFSFTE